MYTLGPAVFLGTIDSKSKPRETPKTRIARKIENLTSKFVLRVKEFSLIWLRKEGPNNIFNHYKEGKYSRLCFRKSPLGNIIRHFLFAKQMVFK